MRAAVSEVSAVLAGQWDYRIRAIANTDIITNNSDPLICHGRRDEIRIVKLHRSKLQHGMQITLK